MGMPVAATWDQDGFRFRNDDGDAGAATWAAAFNTDAGIDLDTTFRVRFLAQETAGATEGDTPQFGWEFSRNSGAYTAPTGSTEAQVGDSTHFSTDQTADANQRVGSGTLRDGEIVENTAVGSSLTATLGNDEYEVEFVAVLDGVGGAVDGDTFDFRLLVSGSALDTYTRYPRATAQSTNDALTASSVATGAPSVGTPSISQDHALASDDVATGEPVIGAATPTQDHVLVAGNVTTGAPVVGTAILSESHELTTLDAVIGAPSIATATLSQDYALVSDDATIGAPVIDGAIITQGHVLAADNAGAGGPSVSAAILTQDHALAAAGSTVGTPAVGEPAVAQDHNFAAGHATVGAPIIGAAVLVEEAAGDDELTIQDIVMGSPHIDLSRIVFPENTPIGGYAEAESRMAGALAHNRTGRVIADSRTPGTLVGAS